VPVPGGHSASPAAGTGAGQGDGSDVVASSSQLWPAAWLLAGFASSSAFASFSSLSAFEGKRRDVKKGGDWPGSAGADHWSVAVAGRRAAKEQRRERDGQTNQQQPAALCFSHFAPQSFACQPPAATTVVAAKKRLLMVSHQ
jgi:hypothetical protein